MNRALRIGYFVLTTACWYGAFVYALDGDVWRTIGLGFAALLLILLRDTLTGNDVKDRLEYLRGQIEAEQISYSEIAELQSLADYIDPGDTLLLEWAGVPEHTERGTE